MTTLHLTLFGGFDLKTEADIPVVLTARKSRALLAYLAVHPGQAIPRDRLAGLLWDGVPETQARTNLRQALTSIRKALPETPDPIIVADVESVTLDAAQVSTDVILFEQQLAAGSDAVSDALMELYQGDFLDGLNAKARPFEEWMTSERYRLRERALEAMDDRLKDCAAKGADSQAISLAMRILMQDPLREDIHRALMQLYTRIGRPGAALRQYRTCQEILRDELDVAPDPETKGLFDQISKERRDRSAEPHDQLPARTSTPKTPTDERSLEPNRESDPDLAVLQELRLVTIVYIDLTEIFESASELDPEEFSHRINQVYSSLETTIAAHGGKVFSIAGNLVMSAFGVARIRSDDAYRAVHAAFEIQRSLQEAVGAKGLQIGIATGQVLISQMSVGGQDQSSVTGPGVGLASRLATEALPGTIWLSENTWQQLADRLEASESSPAWLSEFGQKRIWQAAKLLLDPGRTNTAFVGRKMELSLAETFLDNLIEGGQARVVLVRGDAGIGKSHLVDEILVVARTRGLITHKAIFFDFDQRSNSDTVRRFLETLTESEGDDGNSRQQAIDRVIADDIVPESHRPFLNDMLAIPQAGEAAERYAAMETRERDQGKSEVMDLILGHRTQEVPFVAVVEDLHWVSDKTMTQLAALCSIFAQHPTLLFMTTRSDRDLVDASWRAAAGNPPLTTIDLTPLTQIEALEMAGQYHNTDPAYAEACIERAAGSPLFLDQLLRSENEDEKNLPGTIQSVILSQVDTLEPTDRRALQAAAVLGPQFELAPLRALLGDENYDPGHLVEKTMIQRPSDQMFFAHALIRDAVLSTLLKSAGKSLHVKAADWFESRNPWQRATHLKWAEDSRAGMAFLDAARDETDKFNPGRAIDLIEQGLALTEDPVEVSALQTSYGENLYQIGRTGKSIEAFEKARDLAIDDDARCRIAIGLATSLRIMDRLQEALGVLEDAEALADKTNHETLASIYFMKGNIHFPLGNLDACLSAHQASHDHASKTQSVRLEAQAIGGMADAYYQRGQMRTAFEHFRRCVDLSREKGYRRLQAATLDGFCQYFLLETEAAVATTLETVRLSQEIYDPRSEMIAVGTLPIMYIYSEEFDEARKHAERYVELATAMNAGRFLKEALLYAPLARAWEGKKKEGARELRELYDTFEAADQTFIGPWLLGAIAIFTPDKEERSWALEEGERLLDSGCVGHSNFYFYQQAIEAEIVEKNWSGVEKYTTAFEAYTAAEPVPWSDFFIERGRAISAAAQASESDKGELEEKLKRLRMQAKAAKLELAIPEIDQALSGL